MGGILEVITPILASVVGPEVAGVAAPALLGAGAGALESGITGGNPLTGAFTGGLTGGALGGFGGAGGLLDTATGGALGGIGSDVLIGAATGALGSGITGQDPLKGTLGGAASGALSGILSPGTPSGQGGASAGAGQGGPAGGAAGAAAPAGVAAPAAATGTLSGGDISGFGQGTFPTGNIGLDPTLGSSVGGGGAGGAGIGGAGGASADAGGAGAATGGGGGGATTGPGSPAPSTFSNFLKDPTLGNLGKTLGANANLLVPAAGLGVSALKGNQQPAGYGQILNTANQLSGQSEQLRSYLQSGTLPQGLQTSINQATQSAKAAIRSQYASRGMSGSSAEAQDLAAADTNAQTQAAQLGLQLLQQGVSESNLSSELYQAILGRSLQQDQNLQQAITGFATAAAGGGGARGG